MRIEDTEEYKEQSPYSDPELRQRLKNKIEAEERGGRAGEWSARKSQLLAQEYKKAGGKYKGPKTDEAKALDTWTKQEWTTIDGKPALEPGSGRMRRYLPKAEWDKLTEAQKQATNLKKLNGSGQYVPNTAASKL